MRNVIKGPRGSGKTELLADEFQKLFDLSVTKGILPIVVVFSTPRARQLEARYPLMRGCVVSIEDFVRTNKGAVDKGPILIDDVDLVLEVLLRRAPHLVTMGSNSEVILDEFAEGEENENESKDNKDQP